MKRAIITGGTGFIGKHLIRELLNNGYRVTAIVRDASRVQGDFLDNSAFDYIENSIFSISLSDLKETIGYDYFFHLAWEGVSTEKKNDFQLQLNNINMAIRALEICAALSCSRFIMAGTVAEYALKQGIIDVCSGQKPNDMYGAAKTSAHYFIDVRARQLKQPYIWVMIPSTYGEGRSKNNIITYTIMSLLRREKPFYDNLEQLWDFMYVREVVCAIRYIAERGVVGKTYGVGSGTFRRLREYIEIIRDMIDPELEIGIGESIGKDKMAFSSCVNVYEMMYDTGFVPKVSFEEGIKRTIDYYSGHNNSPMF